jgi:hypothetical protein
MSLVMGAVIAVFGAAFVIGIAAYAVHRSTAHQEHKD